MGAFDWLPYREFSQLSRYNTWCILYICFGACFYGYDSGITSSVLAYDSFLTYFKMDAVRIGSFNAAYYAACAVGTGLNWWLPNIFGRLRCIQAACIISLIGIALQTGSQSYGMFVAGRVVGGIACGIIFALCPVYASEISPPFIRGRVAALYSLNISFSYMITEWFGLAFYFIGGNASWRLLFGLQFIPGTVMFICSFWMPFSPRWLALKGRYEECLETLRKIHDNQEDHTFYEKEYHQIRAQIEQDKAEKLGIMDIFRRKSYARRVGLIALFFFAQQCTGIIPLSNYQVIIYQDIGASTVLSLILTGVWGTVSTCSVLTLGFWVDKIGRRNALFLGYSIMIPAACIIVGCWAGFESSGSLTLAKVVNFGIFLTDFGFSGIMNTFGPAYGAEIMPTNIRSAGVAIGYFVFNVLIVLHVETAPLAIKALSWRYFLIFLCLDVAYVPIVYFFYPETKGKTLEEIEGIFGDHVAETWDEADKQVEHEHDFPRSQNEFEFEKAGVGHVEKSETDVT